MENPQPAMGEPLGTMDTASKAIVFASIIVMVFLIALSFVMRPEYAKAQSMPEYGKYPLFVFTSTVWQDEALVTAPGAGYRYVMTDINYSIRTAAEDDYIRFCQYTGTTVGSELFELSIDAEGMNGYHHFNPGIPLTSNYGIWADYVGADSGVAYVVINGFVEGQ